MSQSLWRNCIWFYPFAVSFKKFDFSLHITLCSVFKVQCFALQSITKSSRLASFAVSFGNRRFCPRLDDLVDHKVASARFTRCFPSENQRLCPGLVNFAIPQNHSALLRLDDLVILLSQGLVGLSGLEPPTSRLSGARSNRLSYKPISLGQRALRVSASLPYSPPPSAFSDLGGDEENRTPDPLLARQVLSQLSYTPGFHR